MSVGIIAEYNPFHNGHLFHINETKRGAPNEPIVVVLSANFTQRGTPAFCDKWARTQIALENGANLVVELPTFFSCGSGQVFAQAVDILNALQVSHISFGVEDSEMLEKVSLILSQESPSFKQALRLELSKGASFAKAISLALDGEYEGSGAFASKPNNSLALSYLSRIKKMNYKIIPLPIKREGLGHHASATEIRKNFLCDTLENSDLPQSTKKILEKCKAENRICANFENSQNSQKMWEFLQIIFLSQARESIKNIDGMNEGLEGLFLNNINHAASLDDFVGRCVCARYTRGRIQRQIVRVLLGINKWTGHAGRRAGPRYVRVLGYDEIGKKILRASRNSEIEIVTRLASVKDKIGMEIAKIEFKSSKLWELVIGAGQSEKDEKDMKPIATTAEGTLALGAKKASLTEGGGGKADGGSFFKIPLPI